MKHTLKRFVSFVLLSCSSALFAPNVYGPAYFLGHIGDPVGNGVALNADRTHLPDRDDWMSVLSVQTGFSQNWNSEKIGSYLFFNGTNTMKVGTRFDANNNNDIFSFNFLLGDTFESTITTNPRVRTSTTDFRAFVGLDRWLNGLYLEANLPVVWTSWNMNLTENVTSPVTAGDLPAGDFAGGALNSPVQNVKEFLQGGATVTGGQTLPTGLAWGLVNGKQTQAGVGNCNLTLGYDFIAKDDRYLAFGINGLLNGAKKSKSIYWFEPQIGTAHRQGIGFVAQGGYTFWKSETDNRYVSGHFKCNVNHLFAATVNRNFDIKNHGVGSRYLLVTEMTSAFAVVANTIQNAINPAGGPVKVKINAMCNLDFVLHYSRDTMTMDFGYQLWGHTGEKLKSFEWTYGTTANYGAVYAFYNAGNNPATGANPGTNPTWSAENITINGTKGTTGLLAGDVAQADLNNTLNSTSQLIVESGLQPRALTNTIFGNFSRTWDKKKYKPFLGWGLAGTFSGSSNKALNQWHIFANGGVSF